MRKIMVLSFIMISTFTGASELPKKTLKTATLSANLSTGLVEELNASLVIKSSSTNPKAWVIERWNACPSYPCMPKDYMESTEVIPTVIRDERAGDGDLEIKLNEEMTIIYQNSGLNPGKTKNKTDYKLLYKKEGQSQEAPLYLKAGIFTQS